MKAKNVFNKHCKYSFLSRKANILFTPPPEAGILEGITRNLVIKLAKEEGIEEGMEKGLVEARREDILELLRLKFGDVSDEMKGKIITLEDVAKLNEVFKLAVIAKDMEEFERKVKEVI